MIYDKIIQYYKGLNKKEKRYILGGIGLFGLYKLTSNRKEKKRRKKYASSVNNART